MKISSASKKVLASALSAAMVVAFAPTVAFAKSGDPITVNVDLNGGAATAASGSITFPNAKQGATIILPTVEKDGVAATWTVDMNGDGEIANVVSGGTTTVKEIYANGDSLTLPADGTATLSVKAEYATPSLGNVTVGSDNKLNVEVKGSKFANIAADSYKVALYATDGSVVSNAFASAKITAGANAKANLTYATALSAKGTYKVVLTSGDEKVEYGFADVEVAEVKVGNTTNYAVKGQQYDLSTGTYTKKGDTDGIYTGKVVIDGDTEFAATADTDFAKATGLDGKVVTVNVGTLATAASGETVKYGISVAGDNGIAYAANDVVAGDLKIGFAQDYAGAKFSGDIKAGNFTVTLTKTVSKSGQADVVTKKVTKFAITEVKYDAAGGSFTKDGALDTAAENDYFVLNTVTTGKSLADGTLAANLTAPEGKQFKEWQLDGKKVTDLSTVAAGAVNTIIAVYKDAAADTKVAAPTVESVTKNADNTYTIKLGLEAGATAVYAINPDSAPSDTVTGNAYVAADGIKVNNATSTVYVQANPQAGVTAGTTASKIVKIVNNGTAFAAFNGIAKGSTTNLEKYVGQSTTKWLADADIAAAIAAGKTAAEANVYGEEKAMAKEAKAAEKAVYDATIKAVKAELAKYEGEALVVVGDAAYSVKAADLKTAVDNVAALEAAMAKETDASAINYASYINTAVIYANAAIRTKAVKSAVKAADIQAAQAVTEQLKAAKTADEAKAAVEAYTKLTDDQKKLVATADVAAANEIISKAALVDSQDLAAARDLNGKKVTAKAKVGKKVQGKSFTYKLAASESGATASYKKASGSKYIKISKSGKVTFSKVKVQKKAKTYSAKVTVTYGTQTVTKTVKLVVKKK